MTDRLRPLWSFEDLEGTQQRLRAQLEQETSNAGRAEVLTQLARIESLRDEFDACEELLQEAEGLAGSSSIAKTRIDLERGRKLRSSGDGEGSVRLFESAFRLACENGDYFLAGDAAHMVAIAVPEKMLEWTKRGLELADSQPDAAYWAGPLLDNLGWHYYDAGDYEAALDAFERALEVRKRDPKNQAAIALAEEAVDEALKALGRLPT